MMTPLSKSPCSTIRNQRGSYFAVSAIALLVMFGFAALGIEAARWYAVQGELSKSIDGAAFAGAANVNNPNIGDLNLFVEQVAQANFGDGLLGTDTAQFIVTPDGNGKITVNGSTNAINGLAKGYNPAYDKTHVATSGSAKLRLAEIALVLDISGSMSSAIGDLRDSAKGFVENFEDQEADNQFALLTFASGVQERFDMDHNYVSPITSQINTLNADGWTNTEDALAQTGALPWSDQSALPANEKAMQAVIFFSDGNPTAFRGDFKYRNQTYDGVAAGGGSVDDDLFKPGPQDSKYSNVEKVHRTGDGKKKNQSACGSGVGDTVKWEIFSDPTYGLDTFAPTAGLDPEECIMSADLLEQYHEYVIRKMAVDNAQALKDRGIRVYTIGLGNVDQDFLLSLSSGPKYAFYTPNSSELEGIFQTIANILKLVLVS